MTGGEWLLLSIKSLGLFDITDRGADGPLVRRQALAGSVRPCNNGDDVEQSE